MLDMTTSTDHHTAATSIVVVKDSHTLSPREYTVTSREGESTAAELPYLLTGKRGAEFLLMRHRDDPTILHALPGNLLRGNGESARRLGRFTDAGGELRSIENR